MRQSLRWQVARLEQPPQLMGADDRTGPKAIVIVEGRPGRKDQEEALKAYDPIAKRYGLSGGRVYTDLV
ncbi:MAG: hypothetical protein Q8O86_01925 [Dehalococcoidia bacterium]|nr:hypothetical protein [Dehalococcoidia bacterium]